MTITALGSRLVRHREAAMCRTRQKEHHMKNSIALPKVSSADVLEALGLEHRRSRASKLVTGLGIATVGALVGAFVLLLGSVLLGESRVAHVDPDSAGA
jgi:hypothetical protein